MMAKKRLRHQQEKAVMAGSDSWTKKQLLRSLFLLRDWDLS